MMQHYILYKPRSPNDYRNTLMGETSISEEPLLPSETHNVHNNRLTV